MGKLIWLKKTLHGHTLTFIPEHFPCLPLFSLDRLLKQSKMCYSVQQLKCTHWGNQPTNNVFLVCSTLKWDAGESILSLKWYAHPRAESVFLVQSHFNTCKTLEETSTVFTHWITSQSFTFACIAETVIFKNTTMMKTYSRSGPYIKYIFIQTCKISKYGNPNISLIFEIFPSYITVQKFQVAKSLMLTKVAFIWSKTQ